MHGEQQEQRAEGGEEMGCSGLSYFNVCLWSDSSSDPGTVGTEEFMVHICLLFLSACWPLALMTSIPLCGILCTTRNSFLCTQDTLQTSFLSRYVLGRNKQLTETVKG